MATIDEVKEFIGFLKLLFATFVALDVSLVAWLVKSHDINSMWLNIASLILVMLFSMAIIVTVKSILKKIKYLKDL